MSTIAQLRKAAFEAVLVVCDRYGLTMESDQVTETVKYPAAQLDVRFTVHLAKRIATVQVQTHGPSDITYVDVCGTEEDVRPCAEADLPLVLTAIHAAAHGETILTIAGDIAA